MAAPYAKGGDAALADHSSGPVRMPQRSSKTVEARVLAARQRRKRGAVVLAADLGLNPSTVGRSVTRHQVPLLAVIDPITGERIRSSRRSGNRYEHPRPGDMIHVDVKNHGKIPAGGGWRLHGRDAAVSAANRHKKIKIGHDFIHTVIDDHTRLACTGIHADEQDNACAEFLHRALASFAAHGVTVRRVAIADAMVHRRGTAGAGSAPPGSSNAGSPNPAAPDQRVNGPNQLDVVAATPSRGRPDS